jgi:hypothetical protein
MGDTVIDQFHGGLNGENKARFAAHVSRAISGEVGPIPTGRVNAIIDQINSLPDDNDIVEYSTAVDNLLAEKPADVTEHYTEEVEVEGKEKGGYGGGVGGGEGPEWIPYKEARANQSGFKWIHPITGESCHPRETVFDADDSSHVRRLVGEAEKKYGALTKLQASFAGIRNEKPGSEGYEEKRDAFNLRHQVEGRRMIADNVTKAVLSAHLFGRDHKDLKESGLLLLALQYLFLRHHLEP